jgi:RNA polymerase sigma-70 factor (ECF subfamily)
MPDQSSFDAFYATTRDRLLRQLTVMTTDPERAKDALQEAYSRAWQRWGRVSRMDDPAAWVRTVAWRVAVSQHRRATAAARLLPRLRGDTSTTMPAVDEVLDVQRALRRLRPEQRRVLVLHHVAGLPLEAIAEETGVAVGTVKSRLARARGALARQLGPAYPAGSPSRAELVHEAHEELS